MKPARPNRCLRLAVLASHFVDYSLELALTLARDHAVLLMADADRLNTECAADRVAQARRRLALVEFHQGDAGRRATAVAALGARLLAFRPHALIAHEDGRRHVSALQRLGGWRGRRLLIVHDPEPHTGRDAALAAARAPLLAAQRARAHTLFAHGAWCAGRLAALTGDDRRIVAIPHGPILRPPAPPRVPSGSGGLVMFGRMEAYKGLDLLLEAQRRLAGRGVSAPLHLLGAGPELQRLALAFAALPGVTVSQGFAPHATVIAALAQADGVVAPYAEATHSGVVAAAFANGRPVLATRVGGLAEQVRDGVNGQLIAPGDPEALADAMQSFALRAPALARGAWETAQGPMAWTHAAQAIVEAAEGLPG